MDTRDVAIIVVGLALVGCRGCRSEPPPRLDAAVQATPAPIAREDAGPPDGGPDVVEVIPISGFDAKGEPAIHRMRDGSVWIVFELMPPSWADEEQEARFQSFDRELSAAIGVAVDQDDREHFHVARPKRDTVERLRTFLGHFQKR